MSQTLLPKDLRKTISSLHSDGRSKPEIFDMVIDQAKSYIASDYQLWMCIRSIVRNTRLKKHSPKPFNSKRDLLMPPELR